MRDSAEYWLELLKLKCEKWLGEGFFLMEYIKVTGERRMGRCISQRA